jgi:hypothetical protein
VLRDAECGPGNQGGGPIDQKQIGHCLQVILALSWLFGKWHFNRRWIGT